MLKKYLQDFFSYQFSLLVGGKKYSDWAENTLTLHTNVPIPNTALAKEVEDACHKKGFVTYSEFLTLDQFGKNGYHSTHKEHGMTDVVYRWPEALAELCKKKEIHHIVEFGPGNGKVGVATIVQAKKLHHELFWSGVEINKNLRDQTKNLFHKKGLEKHLLQNVAIIEELRLTEKCLFVFSYSLDNLAPEVFINTSPKISFPSAMLGITVKNRLLSEIICPEQERQVKAGIYKDSQGFSWDLRKIQLNSMQRVYLPLQSYRTLFKTTKMLPKGSQILIIDEFREPTHKQTYHIGVPRDLQTFSRDFTDFEKFYKTSGSNLLYFPLFLDQLINFLSQLGFGLEEKSGEYALAFKLSMRNGTLPERPRTFALLTSAKKRTTHKKTFILDEGVK